MTIKYKKEYCEEIVNLRAQGITIHEVAFKWGIHRSSLFNWCKRYPEFKEAYQRAEEGFLGWVAEIGRANFHNYKFNDRIYNKWIMYFSHLSDRFNDKPLEIPEFADANTIEKKSVIADKLLADKRINITQYKELQQAINLQFMRENDYYKNQIIELIEKLQEKK